MSNIITIMFFAKEGEDCNLTPMKEEILKPVTVDFEKGLGQKFRQPAGTGIELSTFEEELFKLSDTDVYPLAIKAEALPDNQTRAMNSQITHAVIDYEVRVLKQILWVNNMRFEQQEMYGIGNPMEGDLHGNETEKECVICLTEPRDTAAIPCRHVCMCNGCAKVLSFLTNRCAICRQPVDLHLEMAVRSRSDD